MALAQILPRFDVEPNLTTSLAAVFSARTGEQARAQALAEAEQRGIEKGLAAARAERREHGGGARRLRAADSRRAGALGRRRVRSSRRRVGTDADGPPKQAFRLGRGAAPPVIGAGLASKAVAELSGW